MYLFLSMKRLLVTSTKTFSTSSERCFKVTILGACGSIGQHLSLLLKQHPMVTNLAMYDIVRSTTGVRIDLSHINTRCVCKSYIGADKLERALDGADVVVGLGGAPMKFPASSPPKRGELFKSNATVMLELACAIARYSPCAIIAIITNPVNAMVPLTSEVMMRMNVYDRCKIFGVTTLDLVRASTFAAEINKTNPVCQHVPVIGGHSDETIVPLLSQSTPPLDLWGDVAKRLTKRIREAGLQVIDAKARTGAATLSTAFASARFINSILKALSGEPNVVEYAYVRSNTTEAPYFSNALALGRCGIEADLGFGCISSYEGSLVEKAIPLLKKQIQIGVQFVEDAAAELNK